jgi:primosomal protein N'
MPLYNLYIPKPNFPFETLTYLSDSSLVTGQVCIITIKDQEFYAIVASLSTLQPSQIKNLKSIIRSFDIVLTSQHLEFLYKISFLTFNNLSNLLIPALKPIELLTTTPNSIKELNIPKSSSQANLNYTISQNWSLTIDSIIKNNNYHKYLIITPEQTIASTIISQLSNNPNLDIYTTKTTSNKKLVKLYNSYFANDIPAHPQLYFTNKLDLFIDLSPIDCVIILDEANSSYISENRLYFDTREVAFWASQVYNISLEFISLLPSVRFLDLAKPQLSQLEVPKLRFKFLERQTRQEDFNNILLELDNNSLLIADDLT